jgi:4-diphosphocytidyl-2-C-methyl-D-erythritol kinase
MTASAFAKINLALVVGARRVDGKHEVVTVLQAIDLYDDVELAAADTLAVEGFAGDTLVRNALELLAEAAGVAPDWRVRLTKRIPIAAGLGGGSSDAAAALGLANALLPKGLPPDELHALAATIGADVPFFLRDRPQLGTGDGSELAPLELPEDYVVLLVLSGGERKTSTASVYERFDERQGADGFEDRRARLLDALEQLERPADLAQLPRNDLASSPLTAELERLGAFRADVTGAGPVVYGLFERQEHAELAATLLRGAGRTWVARPVVPPR